MPHHVTGRTTTRRPRSLLTFVVLLGLCALASVPFYPHLLATSAAAAGPGAISFSSGSYVVSETAGSATITLTRTGGTDNQVTAKVSLADVTTSPADYVFAPDALDTSFATGVGADVNVTETVVQPDGKIIIAGSFTTYDGTARNNIARLNPNGSLDTSFDPGTGVNEPAPGTGPIDAIRALALQTDGKIIIGGLFNSFNGTPRNRIARLNSDGSLDTSFNPGTGADGTVWSTRVQPDGKVVIAGAFNSFNGTARNRIARLNSDGSLDTSFNPGTGASSFVYTTALQPDGKVIIGGIFTDYNGTPRNRVARLNSDGSLDTSFNPGTGADSDVLALALQPDGKVVIGGAFTHYNDAARNFIARLNSDGSLDTPFNVDGGNVVDTLALQPDGKILGDFFIPSHSFFGLGRLNSDGTPDATFNPGGGPNNGVFTIAVQPDGKIVVGGSFTAYDNTPRGKVARVNGHLYVTWAAGDASDKTVTLPIVNDTTPESNETLSLSLTPFGGATAGARTSSTLTILDNDAAVSNVSGAGVYAGTATLTATLSVGGAPSAGKSVSFTLNGTSVGSATTNASGVATLTNVSLAGVNAGTYAAAVGASFAGDSGTTGGGATGTLTVGKADQAITFGVLADKTFGDPNFNVTASASSGLTVSFSSNGACTVGGGSVHLTGAGTCTVSAAQAGDGNYNAAAGVQRSFQVAKAATATAVNSSANPSGAGQSVTFTATVTSAAGTPTGSVQFKADGANLGAPVTLNAGGVATLTTSGLASGGHAVTAEYGGDANFVASAGALAGGQTVGSLFEFAQAGFAVNERDGSVVVTVRRLGDATQAAAVEYVTDDGSVPSVPVPCSSVTGLALERCDYTRAQGLIQFAAGETEKTFSVLVNGDSYLEGTESTHVRLSNPTAGAVLGGIPSAVIDIADDTQQTSNPLADSRFFVRQHYHDFLSREPDQEGWDFWVNEIEQCGADAQCREVKRINVSAAFFLSIEFQQTGYLVERMYKAAYGEAAGASALGGQHQTTTPVVRLNEFLTDTQRLGRGVIVGKGDWAGQLEANKRDFALEFVRRARFTSLFPTTMTAEEFVARLDQNAGGVLTAADKAALVTTLGGTPGDATKRAQVLGAVAENEALARAELNRAFVLMEYFGYLRRDPAAAPDTDYTGYEFWLRKLEEFNGNYIRAEMVKGFISSDEYRKRFGQ